MEIPVKDHKNTIKLPSNEEIKISFDNNDISPKNKAEKKKNFNPTQKQ